LEEALLFAAEWYPPCHTSLARQLLKNRLPYQLEIYIRHFAVALKENSNYPLSYKEASNKHALFKCIKANDSKAKLSDFICYPKIGKFYQIELSFNKNFSLFRIMDSFDRSLFFSCKWNLWLVDSCLKRLYKDLIKGEKLRIDLQKLIILILPK
jgi:hypothetical protein